MDRYDENPFTFDWIRGSFISNGREVVFSDTGEVGELRLSGGRLRDRMSYVKVGSGVDLCMLSCSVYGLRIFWYVKRKLVRDSDVVYLSCDEFCSLAGGFGRHVYYRGIRDLCNLGVIARRDVSSFWVNTNYLFNGDRLKILRR
jgi:hypothetical protein